MRPRTAVIQLKALKADAWDVEEAHVKRDRILLEVLKTLAPEVAEAALAIETEIGFWYA